MGFKVVKHRYLPLSNCNGWFDRLEKAIFVSGDLKWSHRTAVLAHEIGHVEQYQEEGPDVSLDKIYASVTTGFPIDTQAIKTYFKIEQDAWVRAARIYDENNIVKDDTFYARVKALQSSMKQAGG